MKIPLFIKTCPACFCLLLVFWSSSSFAQGQQQADHRLVSRFPGSVIEGYEFQENANYHLVLGSLQRVAGRVVPDAQERHPGQLTRITYEIRQGFSGNEVFDFFLNQMKEKGYEQRFTCSGRACGSSNYWANDIFDSRILYGPVENQHYLVMDASLSDDDVTFIALYVITRGNRRIYAHLDILETGGVKLPGRSPEPLTPAVLERALEARPGIILNGVAFDDSDRLVDDSGVSTLAQALETNQTLRVYIVSHLQGSGTLSQLQRRALARAEQVKDRLLALGIDADRISAQGVGPLAPLCEADDCAQRIEIVLQ